MKIKRIGYFCLFLACSVLSVRAQSPTITELGLLPGDLLVAPATNSQLDHAVAKGGDQYLVVWSDFRARSAGSQSIQSDGDVFGTRIDAQGQPIDAVPFLIAGGMGLQQRPLVAWNGASWLVAFSSQDPVGGYFDYQLRAVRVSTGGQILDQTPILFPPTEFTPNDIGLQVVGQNGQWIITRCIYHDDGYGTFLAGQRIDNNGTLLDTSPVMLMDWVYGGTRALSASGEYLVAGPDWNNSFTVKARRIGLNLQPIGDAFNVPSLNIATNGSEYYLTWVADFVNLVGSRMTLDGTLLTPNGTIIVSDFSQYNHSTLAHDGVNWWYEWGVSDILRTVRIDADGTVMDPNGGVPLPIFIGGNVNTAYNPILLPRDGGGVHLFWYDLRVALGYDTNVFMLPISADNVPGTERCVSTGSTNQRDPDLSIGPDNTSAIAFVSELANDDRVLVHLLDGAGLPISAEPIEVYRGPTVGKTGIAFNGSMFLITFDVGTSGQLPTQILARRINVEGAFIDVEPFVVMSGSSPDVEALGQNFLIAGTRYGTNPQVISMWGMRIDGSTGARLDGTAGIFLGGGYVSGWPRVRTDGNEWFAVAHSMWTHDSSQGDAIMARVPPVGPPIQAVNPTPFSGGSGDLDIAFSGKKYLLVWRMNSLANANNYIAGRIMNADGSFPPGYFTIAEAPGRQLRPTVDWDGESFIVAWEDQRNQASFFDARTDIYGVRVSEVGTLIDSVAFPITNTAPGNTGTALSCKPNGVTLVASARFTTTAPFDTYRIGLAAVGVVPADIDADGDVDLIDYAAVYVCMDGPSAIVDTECAPSDLDGDDDVDMRDFVILQTTFTEP